MGPNVSPVAFKAAIMAAMLGGKLPPQLEKRHGFDGYASFCMGRHRERSRRLKSRRGK